MSLLDITGLSHSYGDSRLYSDSALSLNRGEHMGIVGQNGTGKSTLIKICTEQVIPDSGRVAWQPGITIGYLDQYACTNHVLTMEQFLKSSFRSLYELEAKINRLYDEAALSCNMEVLNQASLFRSSWSAAVSTPLIPILPRWFPVWDWSQSVCPVLLRT